MYKFSMCMAREEFCQHVGYIIFIFNFLHSYLAILS